VPSRLIIQCPSSPIICTETLPRPTGPLGGGGNPGG
jgi:hypothetical protein